uniref:Guanine nucleotide exchange factor n=1 Tax=Anopheles coluzzii TaxID=1518534 RepID=A0A8W7PF71_ANOCL
MDSSIITVQAQYSFKGSNNDELCFKKGDIITLTQREEGGWWEGTLGDKTGWFPSNYVKEYVGPLPLSETIRPPEEIQAFRSVVFRDLLESEKAHVAELRGLSENFLEPLEGSLILSSNEYTQLMCNFLEVVEMHEEFLHTLEDCNDRVGKVFLSNAPTMKKIHQFYCAAHPRAIVIVDKFRDELNVFMEKQGAAKPGLLVLTTGLSKPFRRLDKYAAILQELERHMESGHPDRGDTQRSIAVYKDIASSCSATRRQKELELQILTGPVRGWQGAELSTLGDIIHMGSVAVGPEHKDRYLVLFPQTLLILSVSQRMSAFKYEGKLPLTGITVNRLEDTDQLKNAFEISGTLIDRIVAVCQGPNEANRWVELLSPKSGAAEQGNTGAVDMKRNVSSSAVNIPQPPPHVNEADSASEDGDYDNDDNRSSEMIGSAAIPFLRLNDRESLNSGGAHGSARSNAGRSSGIHTSTARLMLGELKLQCSEQSQVSSFEHRDAHGRMACENLLNLDESMQIKHSLQQKTITEERHSMPTYFVGNRFNNSSVTEIYIPSWKEDCQVADAQGTTAGTSNGAGNTDRNSVHSSSLDIPAIVPAPDPVTAELLYNFPASTASGDTGADDRQILDNINSVHLDENVPSAYSNIAHGMLHDREPPEDVVDGVPSRSFSLRQSRSSHNLGRFALVGESEFDFTDSGQYDHHNDQHAHDTSQPHGEMRQDLEKNSATVAGGDGASVEVEQSAAALSEPRRLSALHDHSGHDRVVRSRSEDRVFSLFSSMDREGDAAAEPRLYSGRSRIVVNLYDRSSAAMQRGLMQSAVPPTGGESAQDRITYKTGLYAHWWKKEKLPIFVATSNESLKLPPASGPLSRPMSPRSPCIGDSSNSSSTNSSKPTTSQAGVFPSGGDGLSHPNWNITNLRPAPPLRPAFLSSVAVSGAGSAGGGTGGGRSATASITGSIGGAAASCVGGGSSGGGSTILNTSDSVHHSLSFSSSSKVSPTYEEDALVLRVIEAYCAAYQSTSRNTMHSGPQAATGYHNPIARSGSNYDNIFMNTNTNTPLLSRVSKQQTVWMNANQLPGGGSLNLATYQHQHHHHQSPPQHHHRHRHRTTSRELDAVIPDRDTSPPPPAPEGGGYIGAEYLPLGHPSTGTSVSLYDRRLNRSFETAQGLKRNSKISQLRRSTPQLNGDDGGEHEDAEARGSLLQEDNLRDDMSRNSVSCCNKLWMFYWQHHR